MRRLLIFSVLLACVFFNPYGVQAQESPFGQINVAGDFNDWDSLTPNMQLIASNIWRGDMTITNEHFKFKFATPYFAQDWGINEQDHNTLPLALTAQSTGGDINVHNPTENSQFRFLFNDNTREFAVFLLNNMNANLLKNSSFEAAGSSSTRAKFWQWGNPVHFTHGDSWGSATRLAPAPDYGTARTGSWVGAIPGTSIAASDFGGWWQEAPAESGVMYNGAAWFRSPGGTWTADIQEIKLEFYGFSHGEPLAVFSSPLPSVTSAWTRYGVSGRAPAGAAWARLVINVQGAGAESIMKIDDVELTAFAGRREENFAEWIGADADSCYTFSSWSVCTGKIVSSYIYEGEEIPLARSGLRAASLSGVGSYIQSPRFDDGVGQITFYYRHGYQGNPNLGPEEPVHLSIQVSALGDFWEEVGTISNIFNTVFVQGAAFQFLESPNYVRIVHKGGSTNRVIVDDIFIDEPAFEPRLMTFDNWPGTGATEGCHNFLNWQVCTGIVSSAFAIQGKAAQILGHEDNVNALKSPMFESGYGTISFSYRRGLVGVNTVGLSLEASTNGTDWIILDTISNIDSVVWQNYSAFFVQTAPAQIRIRNIRETNVLENLNTFIDEGFDGGAQPPPGWEFEMIGQYDTAASSGNSGPPSLAFNEDGSYVITPEIVNPTNASFMIKGQSISSENSFIMDGLIGGNWEVLATYSNMSNARVWHDVPLPPGVTQLRFTYNKPAGGNLAFDDLVVVGDGTGGDPTAAQTLVLENVHVRRPVEYRTQDFDTWPTKNSYTSGTTTHEEWGLFGSIMVNSEKAFEGQAARMLRQESEGVLVRIRQTGGDESKRWNIDNIQITDYPGSGPAYFVDFETATTEHIGGATIGSYALSTVSLNGLHWEIGPEALIGSHGNDMKFGSRAARLRYENGVFGSISMIQGKPNGIGEISFHYARANFSGDRSGEAPTFVVEYSVNGGVTWTQIGSETDLDGVNSLTLFSETVNNDGTGEAGDTNPFIMSHFFPDGIGPVSFRYRNFSDSPTGNQIGTLHVQTSADGETWINRAVVTVNNGTYELSETYVDDPTHHYFRIMLVDGSSPVLIDDIKVAKPQPTATVTINGWHTPDLPFIDDEVTLHAQVAPQFGAHSLSVTSYYRIGTSGTFTAVAMDEVSGNLFASATNIPPQPIGTIVQYYMEAWYGGPGSTLTRPITYPPDGENDPAWYGIPRNPPGRVWINEVDYWATDFNWSNFTWQYNTFIELAGHAGLDISDWSIELRSGHTPAFELFGKYLIEDPTAIQEYDDIGFGFWVLASEGIDAPPRDMLLTNLLHETENRPIGIKLLNEMGGVEHAISFHGGFPGHERVTTLDPDGSLTNSISQIGLGAAEGHFGWADDTTMPTPGAPNEGQTFADPAVISADPASLSFLYIVGSVNPPQQTIVVSNAGIAELTYDMSANRTWISINPSGGNLEAGQTQEHTVSINTTGLTGDRSGTISINSDVAVNSPFGIPVALTAIELADALLDYPLDRDGATLAINRGTIGFSANMHLTNGATWTLETLGISGKLGDFAYVSPTNTAMARTVASVSGINNLEQFTITGWLRPTTNEGVHYVLGNRASGHGFEVMTSPDYQNLSFVTSAGGSPASITSTNGTFSTNTWTFFAIVYDSADDGLDAVRFYRGTTNNSAVLYSSHERGDLGTSGESADPFHLGGTGNNAFRGWMDDIRLYSGTLDTMEIEAVRKDGVTRETGEGEPPSISQHPQDRTVMLNAEVAFSVAASGDPLPQYQWRKNGTNISGATSFQFIIGEAKLSDAANYDVIVFNALGSITSEVATLTVNDIPRIITDLEDQHFYQGDSVRFGVGLTGHPWPSIEWTYNGTPLGMFANQTNVTFGAISSSAAGLWRVTASNEYGVAQSRVATVRVLDPNAFPFTTSDALRPEPGGAGIVLRWESAYGRVFDIYWGTNLMAGYESFNPIATGLPPTPPMNVYTDSVHGAESGGFYFIHIREEEE